MEHHDLGVNVLTIQMVHNIQKFDQVFEPPDVTRTIKIATQREKYSTSQLSHYSIVDTHAVLGRLIVEVLVDAFDEVGGTSCSTLGVAVDFGNVLLPQSNFSGCVLSFVERSPFPDPRLNPLFIEQPRKQKANFVSCIC